MNEKKKVPKLTDGNYVPFSNSPYIFFFYSEFCFRLEKSLQQGLDRNRKLFFCLFFMHDEVAERLRFVITIFFTIPANVRFGFGYLPLN